MPQYAALVYGEDADYTTEEQAMMMKEYKGFNDAHGSVIRGGAGLFPVHTATTIQVKGGRGGDVVTSDGPFAETKEVLGGFYLLEADDLDAAIAIAKNIPGAWSGKVEIRPTIPML